jgi:hypothetical protein
MILSDPRGMFYSGKSGCWARKILRWNSGEAQSSSVTPLDLAHTRSAVSDHLLSDSPTPSGPKTSKELALIVIATKELDTGDKVLARATAT